MSQTGDIEYFRKRATEERQRAAKAAEQCIACVHTEMADRYDIIVRAGVAPQFSERRVDRQRGRFPE